MTEATMPAPEHVKHFVVEAETDSGFMPHNETSFAELENPKVVYGPTTFKAAYQEFYRLRAEKAGVADFCARCGFFTNPKQAHNFWCWVPEEQAKAAAEAANG
jgi:hypothetical protein